MPITEGLHQVVIQDRLVVLTSACLDRPPCDLASREPRCRIGAKGDPFGFVVVSRPRLVVDLFAFLFHPPVGVDPVCERSWRLAAIKPKDVREWYAATLTDRPTMRSHAYSLLRTIMGSAVVDELIDANPCRIVGAGRAKRVHKIRPASVEELSAVTNEMPERLRLMVTLASWCALRFGETIELQRGDVDLSDEVIRIRRAAVRTDKGFEVTTPKSDAGVRDVAIPPHLIPAIEAHLAKYVGKKRDSLLFPNECGKHLQPSTLNRHWYKARASAGREDLRWHDLRHSGAVLAAATGASLAELMARLGHSTPQAAMRYQHAAQGRDREIAALLSKLAANREAADH
jgi:integrase